LREGTSTPIFDQVNATFPEVIAVNALYTHGLMLIVSTKVRYGGFAKAVGLRVLSTPHGLGYAKLLQNPVGTDVWLKKLVALTKELQK
jgi:vanillate/4-hydroxybenzoate decarboxylase subunit C